MELSHSFTFDAWYAVKRIRDVLVGEDFDVFHAVRKSEELVNRTLETVISRDAPGIFEIAVDLDIGKTSRMEVVYILSEVESDFRSALQAETGTSRDYVYIRNPLDNEPHLVVLRGESEVLKRFDLYILEKYDGYSKLPREIGAELREWTEKKNRVPYRTVPRD